MRFRQVREILEWNQTIHEQLAQRYAELAQQSSDERVTLMLRYLADHETALQNAVQAYETDAADALLETWFDQAPALELPASLAELKINLQQASVMDIVKIAINTHEFLMAIYRELHDLSDVATAREVFANLLELEQHEAMRTVRDAQRLEDY